MIIVVEDGEWALHISILGLGLLRMLKKTSLPLWISYLLSILFMTLYGCFTGMGISTLRALIMFSMMIWATLIHRTPDVLSSMSLSGAAVLIVKPLYLYDAGFVLSFGAVTAIGALTPILKKLVIYDPYALKKMRKRIYRESKQDRKAHKAFRMKLNSLRMKLVSGLGATADMIISSLAINIFMLPLTLYYFYRIPVWSILINLLVIPLLYPLVICALMASIAGLFSYTAGMLPATVVKLILALFDTICGANDRMPYPLITLGRPAYWQMILYYLIIFFLIFIISRRRTITGKIRLISGVMLLMAAVIMIPQKGSTLRITMIDVGQGDCNLLEQRGRTVMIDCGSSDTDNVAAYRVIPYVMSQGVDTIDYAIVTHMDSDHVNGFEEILNMKEAEGLKIKNIIMPDIVQRDEKYNDFVSMAERRGVRVMQIHAGNRFRTGDMEFVCMNPVENEIYEDCNSASVCLKLKYKGFIALYTGDVQGRGEEILEEGMGSDVIDLLKCAHHGSANSTPESFLNKTKPRYSIISAGVDNRYGHPHKELLRRLEKVGSKCYVTNEMGAISVKTDGKRISIAGYLS